jgi:hypothetical protein
MRLKWVAMLWALILLCLPPAGRADRADFADAGRGASFSATIGRTVVENSAGLISRATAGPFATEPSTGLLLLIGIGLIIGASLIALKMGRSDAVEEGEDPHGMTVHSSPARNFYGPSKPVIPRMSMKSKSVTASMKQVPIRRLRQLSSNR